MTRTCQFGGRHREYRCRRIATYTDGTYTDGTRVLCSAHACEVDDRRAERGEPPITKRIETP